MVESCRGLKKKQTNKHQKGRLRTGVRISGKKTSPKHIPFPVWSWGINNQVNAGTIS